MAEARALYQKQTHSLSQANSQYRQTLSAGLEESTQNMSNACAYPMRPKVRCKVPKGACKMYSTSMGKTCIIKKAVILDRTPC
jgi:hypothetical protein